MEQKDRSCECKDIKNEIRADIQTYFDSMLKFLNDRINNEWLEDGNKKLKDLQEAIDATDRKLEHMRLSLLKTVERYTDAAEKDLKIHRRQYDLLSDQIDKLYYLFFANSVCILLFTVPGSCRFIASFFK